MSALVLKESRKLYIFCLLSVISIEVNRAISVKSSSTFIDQSMVSPIPMRVRVAPSPALVQNLGKGGRGKETGQIKLKQNMGRKIPNILTSANLSSRSTARSG